MNTAKRMTIFVLILIGMLVLINMTNSQQKFNIFKSYENANVKPKQYSKKYLRHSIDEYLTSVQKQMMKRRKDKKDQQNDLFDENWSGFNLDENKGSSIII